MIQRSRLVTKTRRLRRVKGIAVNHRVAVILWRLANPSMPKNRINLIRSLFCKKKSFNKPVSLNNPFLLFRKSKRIDAVIEESNSSSSTSDSSNSTLPSYEVINEKKSKSKRRKRDSSSSSSSDSSDTSSSESS